jgi:hypothetical protein
LVLLLVAIVPPAVALAQGPSAGDNQYTDPLGGTKTTKSTTTATTPATQPATTPTPPSSSSTGSLSASPPAATSAGAGTTTSSTSSSDSGSLPMTGFDAWLGFAVGAGLVVAGVVVRRRIAVD